MTLLEAEQATLISAGLRIGLVLLMLGFASRGLRRLAAHPPFSMPISQAGWALPAAGLAEVVAPLTPGFWVGLGRSASTLDSCAAGNAAGRRGAD